MTQVETDPEERSDQDLDLGRSRGDRRSNITNNSQLRMRASLTVYTFIAINIAQFYLFPLQSEKIYKWGTSHNNVREQGLSKLSFLQTPPS